jgi:hypothetical protein
MTIREFNKINKWLLTNDDLYETPKYQITEVYINKKYVTYEVYNLSFNLESGVVWLSDLDDVISDGEYFKGFVLSSAESELCKNYFSIKLKGLSLLIKLI